MIHPQEKSKEELVKELTELQQKYSSLKESVKENLLIQKRTEKALRNSEERFKLAMEASNDGLYDWNLETQKIYYSPGWKKMLGYEEHELVNEVSVWEELTDTEDVRTTWGLLEGLMTRKTNRFVLEFKMRHKQGHWVNVLSRGEAFYNDEGKAIRIIGTHVNITERKLAELSLRNEKEQIKTILNLVGDPIFVKDDNHCIVLANSAFYKIFNLKEEEVLGYTLSESVPKDEKEHFLAVDRNVLDAGISDLREEKMTVGSICRTIITRKTRFIDTAGNKFLVGSIHDITEQKNILNALAKSEHRLSLALETGLIGAWDLNLLDKSSRRTLIHDQIFGYESLLPEWTYEMFLQHVFLEDKEYVNEAFKGAIESTEDWSFECRINRFIDGELRWIKATGRHVLNLEGDTTYLTGIVQDITDLKSAELELIKAKERAEENEEKFRVYSQYSPVAIYTTDKNGNCIYANNKWLEIAGMRLQECLGNGWMNSLHPDDKDSVFENWNKSVKSHGSWAYEYRFVSKEGKITLVEGSAKPLFNKENELIGYLGSNVDITDRKKAELLLLEKNEELIVAKEKAEESDRLKSAFLANMSHEIRTPMNSIMGFSELLREPNLTGEQQQKYVRIISESGVRMLNIIDDIVDISKIEAGLMELEIEKINVNEQIEYIHSLFNPEVAAKGMQFGFKKALSDKEAVIETDQDKLFAILSNLVKNSIKYSEKGSIKLGYELIKEEDGDLLQFYVKDTGIGISEDRQVAIFERFIQADILDKMARQGAGLGLAISKSYVEMLGGKIWVESKLGKGSGFYFCLPYNIRS
ncbi:hypothetical protein BZG02_07620 [Labilibaculum filiforme]|uniref:histidine kinase n=1 Tax=Labilibaculum filiforme TaxID=1940526 RepID=A0A2N3I0T9_9BACT|nr:PAS domain S-box protein [Labilibaculum filiforme]PKQ63877.1 hypothetical protein BZG02_07620 [Labilibaculum filiforme]